MKINDTKLLGVKIIEPLIISDDRGEIVKPFIINEMQGMDCDFKQSYYAYSKRGLIRGMCYCKAAKLVYCSKGKVLDVIVDLSTKEYIVQELSEQNHLAMYIPAGYAHGYQCFEDSCFNYLQTEVWNPDDEKKVSPDSFGFIWPIKI
jgi:dTDP-4-dehydrorhamnose 3,5-epimerase